MIYRTIYMDPPWLERGAGKSKRGADRHYPLMGVDQILQTVLGSGVWDIASDAHLYCWATSNHLEDALFLIRALGFRFIRDLIWRKRRLATGRDLDRILAPLARARAGEISDLVARTEAMAVLRELQDNCQVGLGQYARGCHELLLFAVRGRGASVVMEPRRRDLLSLVSAERTTHSAKPAKFRAWIESRSQGPYLEMFARGCHPFGWAVWGDGVDLSEMGGAGG